MSFLEFTSKVCGYEFYHNENRIYNYQLFWLRINPDDLIKGKTKYSVRIKEKKQST